MGLLDIFLKNQSNLDINPVPQPGNGPVGTPTGEFNAGTTPFQQVWDSSNTYVKSFEGGTNIGIQPPTLSETGLDVDNPNFIPSTTIPDTLTLYPATVLGGLGQSAVQFLQIWTPVINYNNVMVGAPTSPLRQSLPETGLDNTDVSSVPTTVSPYNPTNYPNLSSGEFGGASTQYSDPYSPNKTYENAYVTNPVNFDTLQTVTLDETGLDNTNSQFVPTTSPPIDPTQYPSLAAGEFGSNSNQYSPQYGPGNTYEVDYVNSPVNFDTLQPPTLGETGLDNTNPLAASTTPIPSTPTNYPNLAAGEFGGASTQYSTPYGPNSTYENNYVTDPITFDTLQPTTLGQTGLDNTNPNFASTTLTPIDNTIYPAVPQTNLGEFNNAIPASTFSPSYNPNFGYLNTYSNIITLAGNIQVNTLGKTGLDVENSNAITFTPNAVSAPTNYPQFVQGEFNGGPTQYTQVWNPFNKYFNTFNPTLTNTIQSSTLGQTGLDNTDINTSPTSQTPTDPTQYPLYTQGEFNGAPIIYNQIWNPNNGYFAIYNPTTGNTAQVNTLSQTGLDTENLNAVPTATIPSNATIYPSLTSGEFGGSAGQFNQNYTPNSTYLNSNFTNAQAGTLDLTGLDNTNNNALPTTVIPNFISAPTIYPQPSQTFLGPFYGAPSQFIVKYYPTPGLSYLDDFNTIINPTFNPQVQNLSNTGLDVENAGAAPTAYAVPEYDTTTVYPAQATGEYNGAATPYGQTYTPGSSYEEIIVNAPNGPVSILENSSQYTGLDIENKNAAPTTYAVPDVDDTIYPVIQGAFSTLSRIAKPYSQSFNPSKTYYSFMIDNYSAQVI
jgi:hypothetical protein